MKFPRHWALGSVGAGLAWGWSDVSREAAQAEADRRARSLDERLRGSRRPDPQDGYYPGRPIREEVLREFGRSGDDLFAAVSPRLAELQNPRDVHFKAAGYDFLGAQVAAAIRAALPEDGIFVDEVSQMGFASRVALPIEKPRTYLSPGYQDNLGWGLGTALGAKAAMPHRKVLAVAGDGGFMYQVGELATAARHNLAVVVVEGAEVLGVQVALEPGARLGRGADQGALGFVHQERVALRIAAAEAMQGGVDAERLGAAPVKGPRQHDLLEGTFLD